MVVAAHTAIYTNMYIKVQLLIFWEGFFIKCGKLAGGINSHSAVGALARSATDVSWVTRPGSQMAFQFIPKVLNGVEG